MKLLKSGAMLRIACTYHLICFQPVSNGLNFMSKCDSCWLFTQTSFVRIETFSAIHIICNFIRILTLFSDPNELQTFSTNDISSEKSSTDAIKTKYQVNTKYSETCRNMQKKSAVISQNLVFFDPKFFYPKLDSTQHLYFFRRTAPIELIST